MKNLKNFPIDLLIITVMEHLCGIKRDNPTKLTWINEDLNSETSVRAIARTILEAMRISPQDMLISLVPLCKALSAAELVIKEDLQLTWVMENKIPTQRDLHKLFFGASDYNEVLSSYIEELLDVLTYESLDQIFKTIGLDPHEDWIRPNESYKHEFDEILYSTQNIPKNTVRELARINHWLSQWNFHAPEYGRAYRNGKNIYVLQENTGIAIFTIKRNGYEQYHYVELECNLEGWEIKGLNDGMVLINSIDRLMEDLDSRHRAIEAFLQHVMGI